MKHFTCRYAEAQVFEENMSLGPEQASTRGPYCFSNNHFFIPNDCIFHCLYISQSIVVLRGAVIKESVFWLITHLYFVTHWKTLYPPVHWIVLNLLDIGHAHFRPCFFFSLQIHQMLRTYFFAKEILMKIWNCVLQSAHTYITWGMSHKLWGWMCCFNP